MRVLHISLWFVLSSSCLAQNRIASGELSGFTQAHGEHIINRLDGPITVRQVNGRISMEIEGKPLDGALIEIRGPGDAKTLMAATANSLGKFRNCDVPPGQYVFKITLDGFQSLVGRLIVDPHAQHSQPIYLQLKPGV